MTERVIFKEIKWEIAVDKKKMTMHSQTLKFLHIYVSYGTKWYNGLNMIIYLFKINSESII